MIDCPICDTPHPEGDEAFDHIATHPPHELTEWIIDQI